MFSILHCLHDAYGPPKSISVQIYACHPCHHYQLIARLLFAACEQADDSFMRPNISFGSLNQPMLADCGTKYLCVCRFPCVKIISYPRSNTCIAVVYMLLYEYIDSLKYCNIIICDIVVKNTILAFISSWQTHLMFKLLRFAGNG